MTIEAVSTNVARIANGTSQVRGIRRLLDDGAACLARRDSIGRTAASRFGGEVRRYPVGDGRGIFRPAVWAFHLGGLVRVLHVAEFDEDRGVFGQVQSGEVVATVQSVGSDVGGRLIAGGDQGVAHRVGELHCEARLGGVQGRAGVVDVESPARWGSAVGVDADDRVWSHPVGLRGALIDARSGGVVVTA